MVRDDHLFRLNIQFINKNGGQTTKANSLFLKSLVQWKRETIHPVLTNASTANHTSYQVLSHFRWHLCSRKSDDTATLVNMIKQNSPFWNQFWHAGSCCVNSFKSAIYILTSSVWISQLLTDHSSISSIPEVTTHCPPLVIDAHLHSTLILIGASHQTNVSIGAVTTGVYCDINEHKN